MLSYFACLKNRTIPLLLDAKIDYDMIKNLIKEYEPDALSYPKDQEELWKKYKIQRVGGCRKCHMK